LTEIAEIAGRLVPELGPADSEPEPLSGGITNLNYRACFGGKDYVVRLPGKDTGLLEIDRGAELVASELAASVGVAPRVAAMLDDPPCLVVEFVGGRTLEAQDLRDPEALNAVAAALRRIHDASETLPSSFSPFRIVETYAETAKERGAELSGRYAEALERSREIEAVLGGPEHEPVPCHNDLLAANFLDDGERIWIVDWEYAGMGDRYFDLGNFAVNNELGDEEMRALLEAYFAAEETPARTLECRLAELWLMRFMSDFREAMWGVVQTVVSEIDFDFDEYAAKHFERLHAASADPSFDRRLAEAAA
jgi:thiamine kinase-like enzyme